MEFIITALSEQRKNSSCGIPSPSNSNMILDNISYKIVLVVKFLGIYIDCKLTWNKQINYISKKCETQINILRTVGEE